MENERIACPSCGKPNAADAKACRYCAAVIGDRLPLAILWWGIAALFLVAAVHFTSALTHRPRRVEIQDLTPARNFQRVRVAGRITDISTTRRSYGESLVRIELAAADAGEYAAPDRRITVRLEGEAARDFALLENPPRRGDAVEVAASLVAGDDFRHLSVSSPQFIRVTERGGGSAVPQAARAAPARAPARAPEVTVAALLAEPQKYRDQAVWVRRADVVEVAEGAAVFKVREPGVKGPTLVVFGWEGSKIEVGQAVSVRGRFEYYGKREYWEIKVPRGDDRAVVVAGRTAPAKE